MRTTVEIDDRQRAELLKLAAQRREKGFSVIVGEAIEAYLRQQRGKRELVKQALALEGAFSDKEADQLRKTVGELRERWR